MELKTRSQHCEVGDLRESLLGDKIVLGAQDKKILERLLRETDLSLDKAISICREVKVQTKEMQSNKTDIASNVDLVKHKSKKRLKPADRKPAKMIKNCKYCGGSHLQAKCPAYGKKCNICFKNNHFANVCKQRKTVKAVNINESNSTSDSDSENVCLVGSIEIKYENKDTVDNDETNTTEMNSVEIETIDPGNAQSDKTVCLDEVKNPYSDSGEIENPVSDSDEIKNTAPHSINSKPFGTHTFYREGVEPIPQLSQKLLPP